MSRSPTVLRRYTPPTCTLEVVAKDSALSRWAAQPVVKDLRFRLSLDDPKLDRDEWIVVEGDRNQLAALCEAVSTYVQQFLELSHEHLNLAQAEPNAAVATLAAADPYQTTSETDQNPVGVRLQPKGLLNHEVHWGNLATAESGAATQLSTLQLFDLANALDEYSTDLLELPDLGRKSWITPLPNWAQIAAVVLIAVGLSTSAIRLLEGSGGNVAIAPTTSQGASSSDQKIATQLPPTVVEKATPPVISNQKLPPPPPVSASPTPQPGTPTVVTPKTQPSPAAGTVSPGAVATYPVPVVPGNPTVITGGGGAPATQTAKKPAPAATADAASATREAPNPAIAARQRAAAEAGAAPNTANSTAFDTIPQVAEVRNYFQQRWKPPEELNQILEYSLQVGADGTIQGITPLRQASGDYIDRTNMPLIGDAFVSPLKGRQTAKIRLVLEPDGQVRTFLEQ